MSTIAVKTYTEILRDLNDAPQVCVYNDPFGISIYYKPDPYSGIFTIYYADTTLSIIITVPKNVDNPIEIIIHCGNTTAKNDAVVLSRIIYDVLSPVKHNTFIERVEAALCAIRLFFGMLEDLSSIRKVTKTFIEKVEGQVKPDIITNLYEVIQHIEEYVKDLPTPHLYLDEDKDIILHFHAKNIALDFHICEEKKDIFWLLTSKEPYNMEASGSCIVDIEKMMKIVKIAIELFTTVGEE